MTSRCKLLVKGHATLVSSNGTAHFLVTMTVAVSTQDQYKDGDGCSGKASFIRCVMKVICRHTNFLLNGLRAYGELAHQCSASHHCEFGRCRYSVM